LSSVCQFVNERKMKTYQLSNDRTITVKKLTVTIKRTYSADKFIEFTRNR